MKYITLYFDTFNQPDLYDTNEASLDYRRFEKAEFVLKFELIQNSLTQKFLSLSQDYLKTGRPQYSYNYYIKKNRDSIQKAQNELLASIQKLNGLGEVQLPLIKWASLKDSAAESHYLNQLHLIFETEKNKAPKNSEVIQRSLWRINNLIHVIEGNKSFGQSSFLPTWHMTSYFHTPKQLNLEPNDYKHFQFMQNGLRIDYNTIGKDLLDCFYTNDLALVQQKRVKQQLTVGTCFMLDFSEPDHSEHIRENYQRWLSENKVGDFLDLSNPIYTPGRASLGKLISPQIQNSAEWAELWKKDYSYAGFRITST